MADDGTAFHIFWIGAMATAENQSAEIYSLTPPPPQNVFGGGSGRVLPPDFSPLIAPTISRHMCNNGSGGGGELCLLNGCSVSGELCQSAAATD